ncbi:MAG: hypothetical protein Q9164_005414 [Protoblastenia rupestris]
MPPIVPDQSFTNLAEFKEALRQWAIERNWTPHILDSDSHRVRAGCRSSPDCPFRIRANYSAKRGDARVTTVDDVHNCEPFRNNGQLSHQNIKRAETGKLKFLVEAVPKMMTVTLETSIHDIVAMVEQKYGQKIPTRQAQKVKGALVIRVKGPCRHCHQMGHTRRHCPQLRVSAPGPIDFSNSGTMDFSRTEHGDSAYADGGLEDTYGEGDTMDFENGQQQSSNMFHQHPRPQSSAAFDHTNHNNTAQPSQNGITVDPGLSDSVQQQYGLPPRPTPIQPISATQQAIQQARANLNLQNHGVPRSTLPLQNNTASQNNMASQNHTTSQNNTGQQNNMASQNDSTPTRTPAETRIEASRLMQQAAQLMQQAAKMNAEAARLTASVASS